MARTATARFGVFGTSGVLIVTEPTVLGRARSLAGRILDAVDLACSSYRPDSELSVVNASGGAPVQVSVLFAEILGAALRAARLTAGDVDPTCGRALSSLHLDRDIAALRADPSWRPAPVSAIAGRPATLVAGWRTVRLDAGRRRVQVGRQATLDLGSVGKAWAADRCAVSIAAELGCGALVSLGGDIGVAGPAPAGGWRVRVTDDHAAAADAPGQTVAIRSGGLATSSTTVRAWTAADGARAHHIIDPATGAPAVSCWRTVSVAAASCVDANTASTAAIIRSRRSPAWLHALGLPGRLVAADGTVSTTAGWPSGADPERPAVPAAPPGDAA